MSKFYGFNAENKLRIPLSQYAAGIIESDYINFSLKKTTLINSIIYNYYKEAPCSISIQKEQYAKELKSYMSPKEYANNTILIDKIILGKINELKQKYTGRQSADINWQITLNKKVKELLTNDSYTSEELYYGDRPGHYVRAILEEYSKLPFYMREKIVFKNIMAQIELAIDNNYMLNITNTAGNHITLIPYKIYTDSLSMFHYLVGLDTYNNSEKALISLRISRIKEIELNYTRVNDWKQFEINAIENTIKEKGIQFVGSNKNVIKVWLSDKGIKKYNNQLHLRPIISQIDSRDPHIYYFECTYIQIQYYFFSFGEEAKILSPESLEQEFKSFYQKALTLYL